MIDGGTEGFVSSLPHRSNVVSGLL
jgi:hypothetical protein